MSTSIALSRAPFFGPGEKKNKKTTTTTSIIRIRIPRIRILLLLLIIIIKRSQRLHVRINRLEPRALLWAFRENRKRNCHSRDGVYVERVNQLS